MNSLLSYILKTQNIGVKYKKQKRGCHGDEIDKEKPV